MGTVAVPLDIPKPPGQWLELLREHGVAYMSRYDVAQRWIHGETHALPPPTGWSFADAMSAFVRSNPVRDQPCSPQYRDDREREDARGFWRWHRRIAWDISEVCDAMIWLHEHGHRELLDDLAARVLAAHTRYAQWLDDGRIVWLPMHYRRTLRNGAREKCHVVDYLSSVLLAVGC